MYTLEIYENSKGLPAQLWPGWRVTIRKGNKDIMKVKRFGLPFGFKTKDEAKKAGKIFLNHPEIDIFFN